ncbi:MAG: HU family DNA-binding protein [Candidatus Omnitrophica bacterium]|nr:HU family DNA-binding protein [Candidatus Omnitrophota bacterium]
MNKAQLASEIAKRAKLSKAKAWETLNATFDTIKTTLKKGQKVSLVGFGSFVVRNRKARMGRNPKTGETIQIKARRVPAFSAGSEFKSLLK